MARDFLYYPQWDSRVAHLGQSRAPKTVGARSDNSHSLTGFAEDAGGRFGMKVSSTVQTGKEKPSARRGIVVEENQPQVFDDGDATGGELSFGVPFAKDDLRAHDAQTFVNVGGAKGTCFVNPTGGIQADAEECPISVGFPAVGEELV